MHDEQLLRYSRHILLPQIDVHGQQRLNRATVLIVGLGGLGSASSLYLASSGIGRLLLADHDKVELSNLQRQIVHGSADIGRDKTASAADRLRQLNPDIELVPINQHLDDANLYQYICDSDLVIDGSDNFATRFAVNRACLRAKKPLVSGAAIRFEAQVSVFDPRVNDSPCYACLYRESGSEEQRCAENGVLAPLVGMIGALQAIEAIKLLLGIGESLVGRLLLIDTLTMELRSLTLRKDPQCPACRT